jgi:Protein of unknown function (DUF3467)
MTTKSIVPKFKYVESGNEFNVYVNHTGVAISSFDVRIMLGQLGMSMDTQPVDGHQPEVTVNMLGSIIMSPSHAKLVCENLRANIELYEKMFGKINVPPQASGQVSAIK